MKAVTEKELKCISYDELIKHFNVFLMTEYHTGLDFVELEKVFSRISTATFGISNYTPLMSLDTGTGCVSYLNYKIFNMKTKELEWEQLLVISRVTKIGINSLIKAQSRLNKNTEE